MDINNKFHKYFQAHITHPHTFPTTNTQHSPTHFSNAKTTPPPPPPRWAKPPFPKPSLSPKSEAFSPINKSSNGNIIVTTTVTFSVNNTQIHNHQINESIQSDRLQLTLASNTINNNSSDAGFSIMNGAKSLTESNGELQVRRFRIIAWLAYKNLHVFFFFVVNKYSLLLHVFVVFNKQKNVNCH